MSGERFTFFWNGPFSQWHPSRFAIDGMIYGTAEQYMMAEKARLFGDGESLAKIMAADEPRDQKAVGRRVRGFDRGSWRTVARDIVYRGNRAKFTTHRDLLALLLATEGTTLVEASPFDTIWNRPRRRRSARARPLGLARNELARRDPHPAARRSAGGAAERGNRRDRGMRMTRSSPGRGGGPAEGWWRGLSGSLRPPSTTGLRPAVPLPVPGRIA